MSFNQDQIRRACGKTIRILRNGTGLAQEKFALQAGVERSHIGAIERGEHTPSLEIIFRLLPHLGVSFAEFATLVEATLRSIRRADKAKAKQKPPEPPTES